LNCFLLWRGLRRSGIYQPSRLWARLLPRVLLACTLMAALLWWIAGDLQHWLVMSHWVRVARCLGSILVAALLYFAVLFASGLRMRDLRHRVAPP
jgi:putative peptidoglycan lipid II flippase